MWISALGRAAPSSLLIENPQMVTFFNHMRVNQENWRSPANVITLFSLWHMNMFICYSGSTKIPFSTVITIS